MPEKRYYWLKLKEDYFNSPKIKKLRKIAGGDTYTIIYLKMQLLSIRNEGIITFERIEPSIQEELALKLDEDVENVAVTLNYLQTQGLIDVNDNDEFLLIEASNNIGSEGQSAERKRRFDKRKEQTALLGNASVTQEKRISISNSNSSYIIKEVIDFLNEKISTNYKSSSRKTITSINARIKEGFTLEDFKTVIEKKCKEWKGTDMEKYLRPETLFGTKFESYLNQNIIIKSNNKKSQAREYSEKQLNDLFDNVSEIQL